MEGGVAAKRQVTIRGTDGFHKKLSLVCPWVVVNQVNILPNSNIFIQGFFFFGGGCPLEQINITKIKGTDIEEATLGDNDLSQYSQPRNAGNAIPGSHLHPLKKMPK